MYHTFLFATIPTSVSIYWNICHLLPSPYRPCLRWLLLDYRMIAMWYGWSSLYSHSISTSRVTSLSPLLEVTWWLWHEWRSNILFQSQLSFTVPFSLKKLVRQYSLTTEVWWNILAQFDLNGLLPCAQLCNRGYAFGLWVSLYVTHILGRLRD